MRRSFVRRCWVTALTRNARRDLSIRVRVLGVRVAGGASFLHGVSLLCRRLLGRLFVAVRSHMEACAGAGSCRFDFNSRACWQQGRCGGEEENKKYENKKQRPPENQIPYS